MKNITPPSAVVGFTVKLICYIAFGSASNFCFIIDLSNLLQLIYNIFRNRDDLVKIQ